MKIASFAEDLEFNDARIMTKVILESDYSKEIRIALKKGQIMKEHSAPYPITVQILDGSINFGVEGEIHPMEAGGIISLAASVKHDLTALKDSVVRLTLSKLDRIERVQKVVEVP